MTENVINPEFLAKLDEILTKVLIQGQLMVIATKQHGKSNACKWLARRMRESDLHKDQKLTSIIFDTVLNWRYSFDIIPYVDYEGIRSIPMVQDLLVDLGFVDSEETRNAIGEIVMNDFIKKRDLKKQLDGQIPFKNIYIIEEIQNVLGTYSMNGSMGRFWLKTVSECANYGQVIIGIGQRLGDISTKIVERSRYFMFGMTAGDNDKRKITRMGGKKMGEVISTLKKGEFIFYDKEGNVADVLGFPLFVQNGKPYEFKNGFNENGYVKRVFLGS